MIAGLVFGKFLPLHKGHLALIDFASKRCDILYIILCYTDRESIPGKTREQWIKHETMVYTHARTISFMYDEKVLPNTSVPSRTASLMWADAFKSIVPDVSRVFTSEAYGAFVAAYMNVEHLVFDEARQSVPVSASQIRSNPFQYWNYIASSARSYFVKKVALVGSESTGKSTLTKALANFFQTSYVPEMARGIIEKTEDCTYHHLVEIAERHASEIIKSVEHANKLLFVDTELLITRSYSSYLFKMPLVVDHWIEEANRCDLYLFLEPDCPYVQDGTRLSATERIKLSVHHKRIFQEANIDLKFINGSWQQRREMAFTLITDTFFKEKAATNR
jgi:HTH-type transcriptional repressor of NAD biosynthesis genes